MEKLKKQMEEIASKNSLLEKEKIEANKSDRINDSHLLETSKWQGLMSSIVTLR